MTDVNTVERTINVFTEPSEDFNLFEGNNNYTFVGLDGSSVAMKSTLDDNNLVTKADSVKYILKATVSNTTDAYVDTKKEGDTQVAYNSTAAEGKISEVELTLAKSGNEGVKPNMWMWKADAAYNPTKKYYIYMTMDAGDFDNNGKLIASNFSIGGVTFSEVKIMKSVNGATAVELTDTEYSNFANNYKALVTGKTDAEMSAINEYIAKLATDPAEYTFLNYVSADGYNLKVNNVKMDGSETPWVVEADEDNDYIGTRLYESAVSKSEDESFYMGKGNDTITFKGDFGDDTITYSEGETLNLSIKNMGGTDITSGYVAEVSGNDVILSVENMYYATAKLTGTAYGHEFGTTTTGANPTTTYTTYKFELQPLHLSSKEAMADTVSAGFKEGDIVWKAVAVWDESKQVWDTDLGNVSYGKNADGKECYVALDKTDFATGATPKFGGTAPISDIELYQVVNGGEAKKITYNYSSMTDSGYYNSQIKGSVTLAGLATSDIADNKLTINSQSLTDLVFEPTVSKKGSTITYTGSRFKEELVSTDATETFDLKSGNDTISFSGNFGKDTVIVTKGDEAWESWKNLYFYKGDGETLYNDVPLVYTESGNNLVISTDVKYYATAKLTGTAYGHEFGKTEASSTTYTTYKFELQPLHLSSKEAMADTVNAGFKEGDIVWKAVAVWDEKNKKWDTNLNNVSYGKNADGKECYVALDKTDFTTEATPKFGGTAPISNIELYQVVNGGEAKKITYNSTLTDLGYYNNQISGQVTIKDYLKKDTVYTTVTSGSDVPMVGVNVNDENLESLYYDAVKSGNSYKGSRLAEVAESTKANESFNLGTTQAHPSVSDVIVFNGNFGKDTVTMNADEFLNLNFVKADGTPYSDVPLEYSVSGNKLTISTEVKYYATAKLTGTAYGHEFGTTTTGANPTTTYTTYKFELQPLHLSSKEAMADTVSAGFKEGDIVWKAVAVWDEKNKKWDTNLNNVSYGKNADGKECYVALDKTDFATGATPKFGGTAPISNIELYQVVNGGEAEKITYDYSSMTDLGYYNKQIKGSVTVSNYDAKYAGSSYGLSVNNSSIAELLNKTITPVKNKFTGTAMNDTANSTKENETFDLKTSLSQDTINCKGIFGDDKVVLNKGEVINLNIQNYGGTAVDYVCEVVGKDLVVAAKDENTYSITVNVAKAGKVDGYTIAAGNYNLVLEKRGTGAASASAYDNKYMWRFENPYNVDAKGNLAQGEEAPHYVYLDLAKGDFTATAGHVTEIAKQTFKSGTTTDLEYTVTGIYHNGEDWIDGYYAAIDDYEDSNIDGRTGYYSTLYNSQVDGSITLLNYAAKDTGATIYMNNATTAFEPKFTIDEKNLDDVIVKGKVTGSTASDKIDISSYVSDTAKGLTINSGSGNDSITGSAYNDTVTVKSLAGQKATVNMAGGTNKVTFGKGDDKYVGSDFASTNLNAGVGNNDITLGSEGTNKVTAKNGSNTVVASKGMNTISLGNATEGNNKYNDITLNGGQNKVTTGKGVDKFTITGGNNTISSGAGEDTFAITAASYNTIKTGAGDKKFTSISAGTNNITTGKGNDSFVISGTGVNNINSGAGDDVFSIAGTGKNVIVGGAGDDTYTFAAFAGNALINDAKGNDTYDFSAGAVGSVVTINDAKGANEFVFDSLKDYYFDVNLTLKKGAAVIDTKTSTATVTNYKYSVGNDIFFASSDITGTSTALGNGVDVNGRKTINEVAIGASSYKLDTGYINTLAQTVANYLTTTDFVSTADVLANGTNTEKQGLLALYANTATGSTGYELIQ